MMSQKPLYGTANKRPRDELVAPLRGEGGASLLLRRAGGRQLHSRHRRLEFNSLNAAEYEAARLRPRSGGEMPHTGDKGVHEAVLEKAKALIDEHIRSKDAFHQALN